MSIGFSYNHDCCNRIVLYRGFTYDQFTGQQ